MHASAEIRIGVDFDNTIVCYDSLFHRVALERGLIPPVLPPRKSDVRNHLRAAGQEDLWTELQGYVYGARMLEADPFPGVLEFFRKCRQRDLDVCIVSHKTQYPFLGQQYDLHLAATGWLTAQGFFDEEGLGLRPEQVSFELTKEAKLNRIGSRGCTHFIDDLPEILGEPGFPSGTERILFDPSGSNEEDPRFTRAESWAWITSRLCL